jgi:hypothetical protein
MANVLTDLAADIYRAADVVGRELVGVIPSATLNTDASQRVAQNDVIRSHFTRSATVGTVSPAMTIPEGTDQTVDTKTMTLGTTASVKIPWTGEDIKHVNNGAGFETIYGDQIRQAMRAIVNQIESQVAADVYKNAGNAYGTSATTPFGSNFNEVAEVRKLLMDRGMPDDGRASIVINTAAGVKLRNLASLQSVNTSGNDDLLRRGTLLDLQNMMIKESGQIALHTAGTGASYDVDLVAGYAAGDKLIHVDTGTGTFVAGDVVTFSSDTSKKYVVGTGFAGDGDGDIALNSGLLAAVADGEDVAIQAAFTANIAFHQAAVEIGMRPMAQPNGGDAAVDRLTVQDPFSGLIFEIAAYKGYNKAMFDVSCLYGYKVWKPDFVCVLQG